MADNETCMWSKFSPFFAELYLNKEIKENSSYSSSAVNLNQIINNFKKEMP
jgi:hypothetical protein